METYYLFTFFIFGTIFGSFFNVVAYRLPLKMSLIKPRSHCPQCDHELTPMELIPILSYLFQGGKCKNCHKKIPIFYPIFETFTGVLFAITYKIFGLTINTFVVLLFTSMILISILSDYLYMVIIDSVLIFFSSCILILKVIDGGFKILPNLLINMLIMFCIMYIIKILGKLLFKQEALGDGDITLMVAISLVLGYDVSIFVIVLASFIALPIALINLKTSDDHILPFGPYLGIAALICIYLQINTSVILSILGF